MNHALLIRADSPAAMETVHAAYKQLLADPLPATTLDYRRAIVQAVLIGRALESAQGSATWQKAAPTTPGVWEMESEETSHEPSQVRVFERSGELWVEDPAIGTNPMEHYHHNLIGIRWRPVVQA